MNAVFTIPDASPESSGFTPPIAASSTGLNAIPAPKPIRIIGGRMSVQRFPSTGARANRSSAAAARPSPTTSGGLIPNRITSFAESPSEKTPMITFPGRNASPTWSGL